MRVAIHVIRGVAGVGPAEQCSIFTFEPADFGVCGPQLFNSAQQAAQTQGLHLHDAVQNPAQKRPSRRRSVLAARLNKGRVYFGSGSGDGFRHRMINDNDSEARSHMNNKNLVQHNLTA